MAQPKPRRQRVSDLGLSSLSWGVLGLFFAQNQWQATRSLYPLIGYAGFFGMLAAGRRAIATLFLVIGFAGFIRLDAPEWPAHMFPLIGCVGVLGLINLRRIVYAALFPLTAFAGLSWSFSEGERVPMLCFLLVGLAGPLVIIAFPRLDALPPIRKICVRACLATLIAASLAGAYLSVYRVARKVQGEGILLIEDDALSMVQAQATRRLVSLQVKLGDRVEPGTIIGEISQDELRDAILQAESTLKDLQDEDLALTQIEEKNRKNREAEVARPKQDIDRAQNDASEKTKLAQREAESEQDQTGTEASLPRAQLERRRKIRQLETKLALYRAALVRKSRIVSQFHGEVAQFLSGRDAMVREGSPVVVIRVPRTQGADRDSELPFDAIVFVPAGAGKKIDLNDSVEVVPATVERSGAWIHPRECRSYSFATSLQIRPGGSSRKSGTG